MVGLGEAGHVMHLQADAVADAVREERAADAGLHRRFRAYRDHAEVLEDPGQREVRVEVQLAVVGAGAHRVAHLQLRGVDRLDQRGEFVGLRGIGAGDVAGIAAEAGAGVDQEAARLRRRDAVAVGVVQHRGVLV